ncbi:hypothetical protein [Paenibacillus glacialis]|uniref:Uncharacterized protein n=1 Tax=Paenibacillus glacialis TaxID=494026 RepID=A0A168F6W8_9BACL|nr:hypothetical protein [Paenibacillus glacialis]OAB35919.1 hypothetical protein PGLA_21030 [Paenibacillus glacialis]
MFKMYLQHKNSFEKVTIDEKKYDDEFDDETSVIFDICKYLHQTGSIDFIVLGFGSDGWPVNCEFDLPSVIEELPEMIQKFNNNEYNCNLGFYEQGVMREIVFRDEEGGKLLLECKSLIHGWSPSPSCIVMEKSTVKEMIEELFRSFITYSQKVCPELLSEKLFRDWISMYNIKIRCLSSYESLK